MRSKSFNMFVFLITLIFFELTFANTDALKIPDAFNAPWYSSLSAFEHHDSGRSHLFSKATFAGSYNGNNTIKTLTAPVSFPSIYNMTYLNSNYIFAYGGSYGNNWNSIGAYLVRLDPHTLEPLWYIQLIDTSKTGEWNYPGVMGILNDGFLYIVYGYRLSKIDPKTGILLNTLQLPTGTGLPENTAYNGFDATSDGILVMKSFYRQAGCTIQGPNAIRDCPNPSDIPNSILVSVNPKTMKIIDEVSLPSAILPRLTIGRYRNKNYVYLFGDKSFFRYSIDTKGLLSRDNAWNPGPMLIENQNTGTALVVLNDWIIGQSNSTPSTTALGVFAVHQGNANKQYFLQPFISDPIPSKNSAVFSPKISWMPSAPSVDTENNLIYVMDAIPGKISALSLTDRGLKMVWKAEQMTTEFLAIIGPKNKRILVGTDLPSTQVPGKNSNDYVVWRNATTGEEIARSLMLPNITSGTMVQPYYNGNAFYPGVLGTLYKLMPEANKESD